MRIPYADWSDNQGESKCVTIQTITFFRRTAGYRLFWPQKEWRYFGRIESRTSCEETKKIQVKLARHVTRMDNRIPSIMLNYRPIGRRNWSSFKRLFDGAEAGLSRPNWWLDDDDDDYYYYYYSDPGVCKYEPVPVLTFIKYLPRHFDRNLKLGMQPISRM
jgi:hypothetical protein